MIAIGISGVFIRRNLNIIFLHARLAMFCESNITTKLKRHELCDKTSRFKVSFCHNVSRYQRTSIDTRVKALADFLLRTWLSFFVKDRIIMKQYCQNKT